MLLLFIRCLVCQQDRITDYYKKVSVSQSVYNPRSQGSLEMVTICGRECYLTHISVVSRSYLARYFLIISVWLFKIGVMLQSLIEYFKANVSILYDHISLGTDGINKKLKSCITEKKMYLVKCR